MSVQIQIDKRGKRTEKQICNRVRANSCEGGCPSEGINEADTFQKFIWRIDGEGRGEITVSRVDGPRNKGGTSGKRVNVRRGWGGGSSINRGLFSVLLDVDDIVVFGNSSRRKQIELVLFPSGGLCIDHKGRLPLAQMV